MGYDEEVTTNTEIATQVWHVTSNISECINSMIENYRSEGWTDLLVGALHKMTEKISENRQVYNTIQGDNVVTKVKQTLKERLQSAAAMQVMELEVSQKYMVTETYGSTLNINLHLQWTPPTMENEHQNRNMALRPAPARVKSKCSYD